MNELFIWFVFMSLIGAQLICASIILVLAYLRKLGIYKGE